MWLSARTARAGSLCDLPTLSTAGRWQGSSDSSCCPCPSRTGQPRSQDPGLGAYKGGQLEKAPLAFLECLVTGPPLRASPPLALRHAAIARGCRLSSLPSLGPYRAAPGSGQCDSSGRWGLLWPAPSYKWW